MFPRVQVNTYQHNTTYFYDFNGDGKLSPPIVIQGHECLPFFLGGIPMPVSTGKWSLSGFCTSPINPFQNATISPNRTKPDFEFNNSRLIDIDGNGFPEYYDSYGGTNDPGFIAYFTSYEGTGYDPDDININEPDDNNQYLTTNGVFPSASDPTATNAANTPGYASSPSPNPYLQTSPVATPVSWWKAQSFQLVTSGRDRKFGIGGTFDPNGGDPLPFVQMTALTGQTLDPSIRNRERDNLSNLGIGWLAP
jgi:general secretion pathway protein G